MAADTLRKPCANQKQSAAFSSTPSPPGLPPDVAELAALLAALPAAIRAGVVAGMKTTAQALSGAKP
jgi:hypothetical protein